MVADIRSLTLYGIPHPDILSPEERASVEWMDFTEERYQDLVSYLRSVRYLPGFTANQKRGLRQQAAIFEEKDGLLFHSSVDSATGKKASSPCASGHNREEQADPRLSRWDRQGSLWKRQDAQQGTPA